MFPVAHTSLYKAHDVSGSLTPLCIRHTIRPLTSHKGTRSSVTSLHTSLVQGLRSLQHDSHRNLLSLTPHQIKAYDVIMRISLWCMSYQDSCKTNAHTTIQQYEFSHQHYSCIGINSHIAFYHKSKTTTITFHHNIKTTYIGIQFINVSQTPKRVYHSIIPTFHVKTSRL